MNYSEKSDIIVPNNKKENFILCIGHICLTHNYFNKQLTVDLYEDVSQKEQKKGK